MCDVCFCFEEGTVLLNCVFASTLSRYDLGKGDLFVQSWASVHISHESMCEPICESICIYVRTDMCTYV